MDRPFGIPDESINTPLPSIWDDLKIVPNDSIMDYTKLSNNEDSISDVISYKTVSLAFVTIRKLQSEVTKIYTLAVRYLENTLIYRIGKLTSYQG